MIILSPVTRLKKKKARHFGDWYTLIITTNTMKTSYFLSAISYFWNLSLPRRDWRMDWLNAFDMGDKWAGGKKNLLSETWKGKLCKIMALASIILFVFTFFLFYYRDIPPRMIPYRDSKLTRLFQGFFSGRGKAVMIVNVNKCSTLFDETFQVFKFSAIAKQVGSLSRLRLLYYYPHLHILSLAPPPHGFWCFKMYVFIREIILLACYIFLALYCHKSNELFQNSWERH